jgi:hypothetical protein
MAKKKNTFIARTTIAPTPMFMRKGSRKKSILTLCTSGVFAGMKSTGYVLDANRELDRIIEQAMDTDLRLAMVNLALPPVSHVFIIMKLKSELRVYDLQNHYASGGEVSTWYDDFSNDTCDCTGYRYFLNGLLRCLQFTTEQLRFMPSPEISVESWEIIDYCAETGNRPSPDEVRGPCLLWCDAVLNRHWVPLLDEAYADDG